MTHRMYHYIYHTVLSFSTFLSSLIFITVLLPLYPLSNIQDSRIHLPFAQQLKYSDGANANLPYPDSLPAPSADRLPYSKGYPL